MLRQVSPQTPLKCNMQQRCICLFSAIITGTGSRGLASKRATSVPFAIDYAAEPDVLLDMLKEVPIIGNIEKPVNRTLRWRLMIAIALQLSSLSCINASG